MRRTGKLLAVDGLATGAVVTREVAALEHELGDDTVEARARVAEAVLARRELTEVLCGLGNDVVVELEDDAPRRLVGDGDVKLAAKTRKKETVSICARSTTSTDGCGGI